MKKTLVAEVVEISPQWWHIPTILEFLWYQILDRNGKHSCEHNQLPVSYITKLRLNLSQDLTAHIPPQHTALRRKNRLRHPSGVAQAANGLPNNILWSRHEIGQLCQIIQHRPLRHHNVLLAETDPIR